MYVSIGYFQSSRNTHNMFRMSHHVLGDSPLCSTHWRQNLFGRHGNSRTTFEGGTARNAKCRTTFQQSAVGLSAVHPEDEEYLSLVTPNPTDTQRSPANWPTFVGH